MLHNVKIVINASISTVVESDIPANIQVTITGANGTPAPIVLDITQPLEAIFQVEDGHYTGTIQAARADGSLIGTAIPFTFDTPATVQALVPSSVTATIMIA